MLKKIAVILLLFGFLSCEKPPPKLSNLNKREIKAMVNDSMMIHRKILDSICKAKSETMVKHLVDSLLVIRHEEIKIKLKNTK